jgi:hypothetical protein
MNNVNSIGPGDPRDAFEGDRVTGKYALNENSGLKGRKPPGIPNGF